MREDVLDIESLFVEAGVDLDEGVLLDVVEGGEDGGEGVLLGAGGLLGDDVGLVGHFE